MNRFENLHAAVTPIEWANKAGLKFYACGYANTLFPYCFNREKLESFLLLYTKNGKGKLSYKGKEYVLNKGDLFFIDTFLYQQYEAQADNWDFVYIHMNYKLLEDFYKEITENGENVVVHYPSFLFECWQKVYDCYNERQENSYEKASINILKLLYNLLNSKKSSVPENIRKTALFIAENFSSELRIDELSKIANISKYHFIRIFSRYYGVTPYEYMILCRMNEAKSLLINSDESIEDISFACGFPSSAAFSKTFKLKNGMSPKMYRKEHKII